MNILKSLIAGIVFLAGATLAQAEVYRCSITQTGRDGWVGEVMFFEVKPETGDAFVLDGYIKTFAGGVVKAELVENNDKRFRVTWVLENVRASNNRQVLDAHYSAIIDRETLQVRVRVILSGFDNDPWGSGTCKRVK